MGIITISREYGSCGQIIGFHLANNLGYLYLNRDLLVEVSNDSGIPITELERYDENPEHPALRALKKFLTPDYPGAITGFAGEEWGAWAAIPELVRTGEAELSILDEDTYLKITQDYMLRMAKRGNVILVGRGSQFLLAKRSNILHVRIVASIEYRIKTSMKLDKISYQEAKNLTKKIDYQRKLYLKRHYQAEWDATDHYHIIVNTELTGVDGAIEIIENTIAKHSFL